MKKILVVIILILAYNPASIPLYGQRSMMDIGLEGGPNRGSLWGNDVLEQYHHPMAGYNGGLFVQYNFKRFISLRTGCYYGQTGSKAAFPMTDPMTLENVKYRASVTFDYLTVPLLLRLTLGKKVNYFVNAGPYVGFLMQEKEHYEKFSNYPEVTSYNKNNFKSTELGFSFGLGLSYPLSNKFDLSFEARNNLGLTDISSLRISDGTIQTNTLNFLLGIKYKLATRKV